jgi:hypothetical protein
MLPRACGVEPIAAAEADDSQLRDFIQVLRRALIELQRAYDDLLADIRAQVLKTFGSSDQAQQELQARAAALLPHCIEGRLKAFVHQLQDAGLGDHASIEAIGSVLVGKPPKAWTDLDRARFEIAIAEQARAFRHLEALVFEELRRTRAGSQPIQIFRIGVSDRHSHEYESVVSVDARDERALGAVVVGLEDTLKAAGLSQNPQLALAALAILSRQFLAEIDESKGPSKDGHRTEVKHGR